jgi:hypothetical protein
LYNVVRERESCSINVYCICNFRYIEGRFVKYPSFPGVAYSLMPKELLFWIGTMEGYLIELL